MVKGFKMNNNKWNKNALGYGEKTNLSSKDDWNKNALKYDPKNDLENSGLSLINDKHGNDHWNKNASEYGKKNIPLKKDQ